MPVGKPFRRTARQFAGGSYTRDGHGAYVRHEGFASDPQHYIRAFEVLQKDILELFDFVEPSHANRRTYSYRIHELHARVCMEVEANCQAILSDNNYVIPAPLLGEPARAHPDMTDYRKINATHRLSSYQVKFPVWRGPYDVRTPFASWEQGGGLSWYQAYNEAKHSRHVNFERANFRQLTDAVAGLVALLASQFITDDFGQSYMVLASDDDDFEYAIGGYFLVKLAHDWPAADRYNFDWQQLKNDANPFELLTF